MVLAQQSIKNSVVETDDEPLIHSQGSLMLSRGGLSHNDILPVWGDVNRQWKLRLSQHENHSTMTIGALANLIRRVQQTPYEIKSQKAFQPLKTKRWQEKFQQAQAGAGWDTFISMFGWDYLGLDLGSWIEIIGKGNPDTQLTGEVMGFRALDSLRCFPTDDPEFPVFYSSHKTGKLHKLHATRVQRMVDNPSIDPSFRQMGFCALSRAYSVFAKQKLMSKYQIEKLGDLPPSGIATFANISQSQLEDAMTLYETDRDAYAQSIFRNIMQLTSLSPESPIKVDFIDFASLPDNFDYPTYMNTDVNLLALAIGDDPQEIWPLSGQAMGTATQSQVLHEKGRGKTFGQMLTQLERIFNIFILPPDMAFKFKPRDTEQNKSDAEVAQAWTTNAIDLKNNGIISTVQAQQFLANTVGEFSDLLLDEAGNLRLDDINDDPVQETTATDTETVIQGEDVMPKADETEAEKDIQSTRLDFENDFEDYLQGLQDKSFGKARAKIVGTAIVNRHGRTAYGDGLETGGVPRDEKTDADLKRISTLSKQNTVDIRNLVNNVFENGISDAEVASKPAVWFNGGIKPFENSGIMSADRNGMYGVTGTDGKDSCKTCQRVQNDVHRYQTWVRRNLVLGTVGQATECEGFNCKHRLEKRPGAKARGRF